MHHGTQKKTGISTVQCSSLFLYPSKTSNIASAVSERACYTVTYWVNRIMSHGSTCTDPWPIWPIPKSDPFNSLTLDPSTHCLLCCMANKLSWFESPGDVISEKWHAWNFLKFHPNFRSQKQFLNWKLPLRRFRFNWQSCSEFQSHVEIQYVKAGGGGTFWALTVIQTSVHTLAVFVLCWIETVFDNVKTAGFSWLNAA